MDRERKRDREEREIEKLDIVKWIDIGMVWRGRGREIERKEKLDIVKGIDIGMGWYG